MKKNKRIPLVVVILIIVVIIFLISKIIGTKNTKQELAKTYEELNANQTYLFEIEKNSSNKIIMAKKGDKTLIDQYSKDSETKTESHTTTLIKDNNTYLILHNREEYYVYYENNIEQNILTDGLEDIISREYTVGEEKVKGKKYKYEEYTGSTIFIMENNLEFDDSEIKTRFYFDKNDDLTYIKTIYGEEAELLKVKLENDVQDSIFDIPSSYAEN